MEAGFRFFPHFRMIANETLSGGLSAYFLFGNALLFRQLAQQVRQRGRNTISAGRLPRDIHFSNSGQRLERRNPRLYYTK
jgi:hypothetical protein